MPRNTTVKTVETVQAATLPDVQSLRITELESQVEALTLKLAKSIDPMKIESDCASVMGQLKAKLKNPARFHKASVSLKNSRSRETKDVDLDGLNDREKAVYKFVMGAKNELSSLAVRLSTWNTGTSLKDAER
jgi:hypothetical protein